MIYPYAWGLLGAARLTQGGGTPLPRSAGVASGALIAGVASIGQPWPIVATNVVGTLALMTLPHGPFLSPDTASIADDRFDPVWSVTHEIRNTELRWWAYSLLRYPGTALIWAAALWFLGDATPGSRVAGAALIPIFYRCLWPLRRVLPTFKRAGDEVENWVELVGWTTLGAVIAAVELVVGAA